MMMMMMMTMMMMMMISEGLLYTEKLKGLAMNLLLSVWKCMG